MWKNFKSVIWSLLKTVKEYRITTVAGAWVFYFLLAIVPLAFLLVSAFNVLGVDISYHIVGKLPEEFKYAAEAIFYTAKNVSKSVTVFFVFTVLFSSFALVNQMRKDGEYIYKKERKGKIGAIKSLSGAVFPIMLFFVFLFVAAVFVFGNTVFSSVKVFGTGRLIFYIVIFTFIISICYLLIILLSRFISPVKIPFTYILLGALISLFIIVLGTAFFIVYVRITNAYNSFYGGLATIVVFLLWSYILMLGLSVGAVFTKKLHDGGLF